MNKRKVIATVVVSTLSSALLSGHVAADTNNLVQNGNFENGLTNWSASKGGEVSTEVTYDEGTGSGVLTPKAVNNYYPNNPFADGSIGQKITVKPNTDYVVTAYVKTDTAGAKGTLAVKSASKNKAIVSQAVTSTEWTKQTLRFNSGDNTAITIRLEKYTYGVTAHSNIYIDNVSMVEETPKVYTEVWRDDFNESDLNLANWGYELGSIRGIEQQHYVNSKENVFLENGDLVLKATDRPKEQQYPNPRNKDRKVIYNSGSVRTHGKQEFLYGKLEIRAKLPKGQAVFPAFWTLGSDFRLDGKIAGDQGHGWPSTGEIDIMELTGDATDGSYNNRTVYQTLHYGAADDDNGKYAGHGTAYTLASGNFNDDYHTFAIDWSKDTISWLVDGKVVRSVDYSDDSVATAILNKPQYAQLNLAMGGAWPGVVATDLAGTEFRIDYVSYSRTEEQEKQAADYYASAPQLSGVQDVTITEGQVPNLLEGVSSQEGYKVDYSIDTEYTFKDEGGNSSVDLVVAGDAQKDKIAQLAPGKYNIHYSAVPTAGITADSKIARKTAVLTISEKAKETSPSSSTETVASSETTPSASSETSTSSTTDPSSSSSTSAVADSVTTPSASFDTSSSSTADSSSSTSTSASTAIDEESTTEPSADSDTSESSTTGTSSSSSTSVDVDSATIPSTSSSSSDISAPESSEGSASVIGGSQSPAPVLIESTQATPEIRAEGAYVDKETGVSVQLTGKDVAEDLTLVVKPLDKANLKGKSSSLDGSDYDVYDIHFEKDGSVYPIQDEAILSLPITDNKKVAEVLYLLPTGDSLAQESLKFEVKDGKALVKVGHFSTYALVYSSDKTSSSQEASSQKSSKVLPKTGETGLVSLTLTGLLLLSVLSFRQLFRKK